MSLISRLFILLAVLTAVYAALSLYSRERCRAKLKKRWHDRGLTGDRDAFIQRGLRQYRRSFRRRLILLVYAVPLGAIVLLIYMMNFR